MKQSLEQIDALDIEKIKDFLMKKYNRVISSSEILDYSVDKYQSLLKNTNKKIEIKIILNAYDDYSISSEITLFEHDIQDNLFKEINVSIKICCFNQYYDQKILKAIKDSITQMQQKPCNNFLEHILYIIKNVNFCEIKKNIPLYKNEIQPTSIEKNFTGILWNVKNYELLKTIKYKNEYCYDKISKKHFPIYILGDQELIFFILLEYLNKNVKKKYFELEKEDFLIAIDLSEFCYYPDAEKYDNSQFNLNNKINNIINYKLEIIEIKRKEETKIKKEELNNSIYESCISYGEFNPDQSIKIITNNQDILDYDKN